MGSNYYVRLDPCPCPCEHCVAPEREHIGKQSGGWEFLFRAGPRRQSWASWKIYLKDKRIFKENGLQVSYEELVNVVEASKGHSNHDTYCKKQGYHGTFKDDEGWAFDESDFC